MDTNHRYHFNFWRARLFFFFWHLRYFLSLGAHYFCRKNSKEAQSTTATRILLTLLSLFVFTQVFWLVLCGTSGIGKRKRWSVSEHQHRIWHRCYLGYLCSWKNIWWAALSNMGHIHVPKRPCALGTGGVGCGGVCYGMGSALTSKKQS